MIETKKSFCRFCHAFCAIEVDVDDGRVVAVRGDASDPIYGGYTCIKGRQLPEQHNHAERLRTSLKRMPDGNYQPIGSEQAMDEIAARLSAIIARHGPRSVATYNGTYAFLNAISLAFNHAWHKGIGSPSFTTSATIDQPAKRVAPARHGMWAGGGHAFGSSDVWVLVGNNPVVSMFGGIPPFNPWKRLRDAQARGLQLIVIDPRRSDVAKRAALHLQVKPGEDPTLLAGIINVILTEALYDGDFVAAHVRGVEQLREAVSAFTPEYVEQRAGVPAALVERAARLFAAGPRGMVSSGTGPDMAPRSNLTEHLVMSLNTLCGRYNRGGEPLNNPGVLRPPSQARAQAIPPAPGWGKTETARIRGLTEFFGEMLTATLSDEILEPGEGQVRALISVGGNPVTAWPDQLKAIRAMQALELNVTIDIKMSATARMADYVIAPKLSLERPDLTLLTDTWYPQPYAHYTPAIVEADGDVLEEWEFFWGLAHRMRTPIELAGGSVDLNAKPTTDMILDLITAGSLIPLAQIRSHAGGRIYKEAIATVAPAGTGAGRLDVAPADVVQELYAVRAEPLVEGAGYRPGERFTHRLISRRLRDVYNSSGRDLAAIKAKFSYNPAYINPLDLAEIAARSGDLIEISSDHATIVGVAEASDDIPSGVISMAHSWGDRPEFDHRVREIGSSTNRLVNNARDFEPITGMARQSAIPVNIRRAPPQTARVTAETPARG